MAAITGVHLSPCLRNMTSHIPTFHTGLLRDGNDQTNQKSLSSFPFGERAMAYSEASKSEPGTMATCHQWYDWTGGM